MTYPIGIIGQVGAGKSTLAEGICQRFERSLIEEPWEKNPYIQVQPHNMFSCQWKMMDLLAESHRRLKKSRSGVCDRLFWEAFEVFARQFKDRLTPEEFTALRMRYNELSSRVYVPDVVIHIVVDPAVAFSRIRKRGRQFELDQYDLGYCQDQNFLYGAVARVIKSAHVVEVDGNESAEQVLTSATRKLRGYERSLGLVGAA